MSPRVPADTRGPAGFSSEHPADGALAAAQPQLRTDEAGLPEALAPRGRAVRSKASLRILTFLAVFGPGLIVMVADNDAGAVSTYTQAGAQYGLHLMWVLLFLLPVTYFVQEMVARLGIATGKGHAAMIFERFGRFWGIFSLADLLLLNFLTMVTEFAAIALASAKLGIDPRWGVCSRRWPS